MYNNLCIIAPNQEAWVQERKRLLVDALKKTGFQINETPNSETHLCLCLGGDGSLLAGIRSLGEHRTNKLISGIHCSNGLGFLHPMLLPNNEKDILNWAKLLKDAIESGQFEIQKRWGLQGQLITKDSVQNLWAMNDLVFSKGRLSRMVKLKVSVDNTVLFEGLRGDGLIAASATGSTAYSFSAGGPIISPELGTVLLTPICSHDLAQRPIVLGPNVEIEIEVLDGKAPCFLTEDGQSGHELESGDKILVRKSEAPVSWWTPTTKQLRSKNQYEQLRHKLGLGGKL